MNRSHLAVGRTSLSWVRPDKVWIIRQRYAIEGGLIRSNQTADGGNDSRVCVAGYLVEDPFLILTIGDIDPLFIIPNKLATVLMIAKINLVGARTFVEPSQVESLETRPTSHKVSRKSRKTYGFLTINHNIVHIANLIIANAQVAGRYIVNTVVGISWAAVGWHDESNEQRWRVLTLRTSRSELTVLLSSWISPLLMTSHQVILTFMQIAVVRFLLQWNTQFSYVACWPWMFKFTPKLNPIFWLLVLPKILHLFMAWEYI